MRQDGENLVLNCGYGHGYSVRQVIESVQRAAGRPLTVVELPRRKGDIPHLIACSDRLQQRLGWAPRYDDLDVIVATALQWEETLLRREAPLTSAA